VGNGTGRIIAGLERGDVIANESGGPIGIHANGIGDLLIPDRGKFTVQSKKGTAIQGAWSGEIEADDTTGTVRITVNAVEIAEEPES